MTLLAIDPGRSAKGEASIGVCLWGLEEIGESGCEWQEILRKAVSYQQLREALRLDPILDFKYIPDDRLHIEYDLTFEDWKVNEIVIEDFVNNAKSRGGQRNGTSECIGMVEDRAWLSGTEFTRQAPAKLGPAKLHAPEGSWKPLKHLRHEDAAFLHGYEYLVGKGVLKPAGLDATM